MTKVPTMRRLAAILAADVVGYSRMIGEDEAGTLAALRRIWSELFNPAVVGHRGRVVKMLGDGALVEFGSAVDAVECAVAIQNAMSKRNEEAEAKPLQFRIGVNLGDIVIEGADIFGDGVNVAARLESQAPHGGVLMSDAVHAQVKGKVDLAFSDAGEIALKNIERPVHAWIWGGDKIAAAASHLVYGVPSSSPEKPSIAVLPFENMSTDPEQEFFADGLVDDILTTLSKLSGLNVIARNSSFAYKGRNIDVRQVARELGVRFVLEGSVRSAGNRMRITAQLIDATTGAHIWADRFDRNVDDIFAVQDEITLTLATEMQVRLTDGEQARIRYTTTTNVEAWGLWMKGLQYYHGPVTGKHQIQARSCWEKALALDPDSAPLNAMLGFAHYADARFGWWDDRETAIGKAEVYARRALEIDPENPDAYRAVSGVLLIRSRFDEAVAAVRKAIEFSSNYPDTLMFAGYVLASCGRAGEAIPLHDRALKLSPTYPDNYLGVIGNAYRLVGRSHEAVAAFRAYHARSPGFGLADLLMMQEQAGEIEAARETAAQHLVARPTFTVSSWLRTQFRSDVDQLAADTAASGSGDLSKALSHRGSASSRS
jgi:adenylate cyclase